MKQIQKYGQNLSEFNHPSFDMVEALQVFPFELTDYRQSGFG